MLKALDQKTAAKPADAGSRRGSVTCIGAGNIGSHLTRFLAAMRLERVLIVDFDRYEAKNLRSQSIRPRDVGKPKAVVQARRMRKLDPGLNVAGLHARLEDVPLGKLRADVIVGCLDSRAARLAMNEIAWRLGCAVIDTGVDAAQTLARVEVYRPGPNASCLECRYGDADYEAVEQQHACGADEVAATNAPASLGGLAASLAAIECRKMLAGQWDKVLVGRQATFELEHHQYYVTRMTRNPACGFDHDVWNIETTAAPVTKTTLTELCELGRVVPGETSIALAGQPFVRALYCPGCEKPGPRCWLPARRIPASRRKCPRCRQPMVIRGIDVHDNIAVGNLSARHRQRTLTGFGLRQGDVVTLRKGADVRHVQLDSGPGLPKQKGTER